MSGLKMTTNGDEVLADLTEYVGQIQDKLDDDTIKECLREIGKTIKGYVVNMHRRGQKRIRRTS